MRISLNWINQYVDISRITPEEIARKLTFAGIEVETIDRIAVGTNLVTAYVVEAKKMDGSDHLSLCQVDMGPNFGTTQIVCGAPNIKTGQKVIVARPGAVLDKVKISRSNIRGNESNGMICSLLELGVDDKNFSDDQKDGIEVLPGDTPIGIEDVLKLLGLDDTILSLKLLANRPDAMALYNVAKEIGLLFDLPVKDWKQSLPSGKKPDFTITVNTPKCRLFSIRTVHGICNGTTPEYIKRALSSMGMRPISPLVDISNYVMLLTGQPLHFYDLDKLKGKELVISEQFEGTFTALDDKSYSILKGDIAITNGKELACLAGIMGSNHHGVSATTTSIAIEAAHFDGATIRGTATRLNLLSESSQRFIKGTNPHQIEDVLDLTVLLIKEILGCREYSSTVSHDTVVHQRKEITFTREAINMRLGTSFSMAEIEATLTKIGFDIAHRESKVVALVPFARIDVDGIVDLSEEVIRIQGFEHIDAKLPHLVAINAGFSKGQTRQEALRSLLLNRGLDEILTYTLLNKSEAESYRFLNKDELYRLSNPMTVDREYVRGGLSFSLLQSANYNVARQNKQLAMFELSSIETKHSRSAHLGIVLVGQKSARQMLVTRPYDFYDAKGMFEAIMSLLGIDAARYRYERLTGCPELHPGQSAAIHVDNKPCGIIGALSPLGAQPFDFKKLDVVLLEIDLGYILGLKVNPVKMAPLSKFPTVMRDIAVIVEEEVDAATIIKAIRKTNKELIRNVEIFDVYAGTGIPAGKKSIALTMHINSENRTLTDFETNEVIEKVKIALASGFNASFRI